MGYYTENGIQCFSPDNTADKLYIPLWGDMKAEFLNQIITEHFGDIGNDYNISAESIHTRCLGYDLYDSSDYDIFFIITRDT